MKAKIVEYKPVKNYAFVFVCQEGDLEIMAVLLAASLKRNLRCEYELFAAIPRPQQKWGKPSQVTLKLLKQMGVKIFPFYNNISVKFQADLYTNKAYCLRVPTKMDKIIYMDADMFCVREFFGEDRFSVPLNAKPEWRVFIKNWEEIYQAAGMKMPKTRFRSTVTREFMPPFFNTGFFGIDAKLAQAFSREWLSCFKQIDKSGVMKDSFLKEPVSFVLSAQKMGIQYDILDERYNNTFLANRHNFKPMPYFIHHFRLLKYLAKVPFVVKLVKTLQAEYPGINNIKLSGNWQLFFFILSNIKDK